MVKRWSLYGLLSLLLLLAARPVFAGVLTSGAYSYLLGGQEIELGVDMLSQRGGYLLPSELFDRVGVALTREGEQVTLRRGPVQISLALGEETARVDGRLRPLQNAPISVADRLFVPAEVLPDLALSLEVEGKFALLTDFAPDEGAAALGPSDPRFAENWRQQTAQAPVRDGTQVGAATLTMLTPSLLADPALSLPWGVRMRLRSLVEKRTLVMVTLENQSVRAMAFDPTKLMLVGEAGAQYDYLGVEIAVTGSVAEAVAPRAIRTSVLLFPKVDGYNVSLYHDGTQAVLGRLPSP